MSRVVYGNVGSGSVNVYAAPAFTDVVLENLTFTITAVGAGGIHRARLQLTDNAGTPFGTYDDLNVSAGGQLTIYTYGLGLNASACTAATGWAVTDALPWTDIPAGGSVIVTAITDNGVTIGGDAIGAVVLKVSYTQGEVPPLQPIIEMPPSIAA